MISTMLGTKHKKKTDRSILCPCRANKQEYRGDTANWSQYMMAMSIGIQEASNSCSIRGESILRRKKLENIGTNKARLMSF